MNRESFHDILQRNSVIADYCPYGPTDEEMEDEHPFPTPSKVILSFEEQVPGVDEMQLIDTYPIEDIVSLVTNEMALIRENSGQMESYREALTYLEERMDEVKGLIRSNVRDDHHIRSINYSLVNLCALAFLTISEPER